MGRDLVVGYVVVWYKLVGYVVVGDKLVRNLLERFDVVGSELGLIGVSSSAER